jgi:hypothetical protein
LLTNSQDICKDVPLRRYSCACFAPGWGLVCWSPKQLTRRAQIFVFYPQVQTLSGTVMVFRTASHHGRMTPVPWTRMISTSYMMSTVIKRLFEQR